MGEPACHDGPSVDSRHAFRHYPNVLTSTTLTAPDQAWVADSTSIRLPTSFVSLAAVLDAYSRYGVGWQLSHAIDTLLTLAALDQALTWRCPGVGRIHHSDQGVQYASNACVDRLQEAEAQISMAAAGNPLRMPRPSASFGHASMRRCTSTSTMVSLMLRPISAALSTMCTTPSDYTPVWGMCRRPNVRPRLLPQCEKVTTSSVRS